MFGDPKPRVVLFDLYKTLLDISTDEQRPELWDLLARFLRYRGLPADGAALSAGFFELCRRSVTESREAHAEVDVARVFCTLLDRLSCKEPQAFAVEVAQLFRALTIVHFSLYPDTLPALEALRGRFVLGLVTDAQRVFLEPELAMTGLPRLLDVIIVSSDHGFHKPDPRLFRMALERAGACVDQAVYVGDSVARDIEGACNANLRGILLDRDNSYVPAPGPRRPWKVIHGLRELDDWLMR